jgi:hypothetical protein
MVNFLDEHATLVEQVRLDLVRGLKKPNTGRDGMTPSQTLRSLILMRIKNWDYRELRERINDGYTLRTFTTSIASACPSMMLSIAPSVASPQPPCKRSIRLWSKALSNSVWKMASDCASIPRGGNRYPLPYRCHLAVGHRAHGYAVGPGSA